MNAHERMWGGGLLTWNEIMICAGELVGMGWGLSNPDTINIKSGSGLICSRRSITSITPNIELID